MELKFGSVGTVCSVRSGFYRTKVELKLAKFLLFRRVQIVFIVPKWNWNGNWLAVLTKPRKVFIVPKWNWNGRNETAYCPQKGFYRTKVELKCRFVRFCRQQPVFLSYQSGIEIKVVDVTQFQFFFVFIVPKWNWNSWIICLNPSGANRFYRTKVELK